MQQPFSEFVEERLSACVLAPYLNVPPKEFLLELLNQYLFSLLYTLFYQSFFAENYCRSNHLQNALDRLQRKVSTMTRKLNLLRQEEITQEIQMIMLSVDILLNEVELRYLKS